MNEKNFRQYKIFLNFRKLTQYFADQKHQNSEFQKYIERNITFDMKYKDK